MMDISSDIGRFEKLSDDVLIKIAEGKDDKKSLLVALLELSKRRVPRRLEICQELLRDPAQNVTVKETVAIQLGSEQLAENQELLLQHLNIKEPSVFARLVQSLGKIGNEQALNRLEEIKAPDAAVSRDSLKFAKSLLAYRLRLNRNLVTLPPNNDILEITRGVPIEIKKVEAVEVREAFKHVETHLPAIPLAADSVTKLTWPNVELLLVFTDNFQEPKSLKSILDRSALPMVLLHKAGFLGIYFLSEYFFTHQSGHRKEVVLLGTRPRGNLTYAGKIQISEEGFDFKLKSMDSLYVLAMELEGRYDLKKRSFHFTKAISSTEIAGRKAKAQTPSKVALSLD